MRMVHYVGAELFMPVLCRLRSDHRFLWCDYQMKYKFKHLQLKVELASTQAQTH